MVSLTCALITYVKISEMKINKGGEHRNPALDTETLTGPLVYFHF